MDSNTYIDQSEIPTLWGLLKSLKDELDGWETSEDFRRIMTQAKLMEERCEAQYYRVSYESPESTKLREVWHTLWRNFRSLKEEAFQIYQRVYGHSIKETPTSEPNGPRGPWIEQESSFEGGLISILRLRGFEAVIYDYGDNEEEDPAVIRIMADNHTSKDGACAYKGSAESTQEAREMVEIWLRDLCFEILRSLGEPQLEPAPEISK